MNMRWTRWIWYAGAGAWTFSGLVATHYHAWLHAKIAFALAVLFIGAGMFFQQQRKDKGQRD
jgi:hypothetical protein